MPAVALLLAVVVPLLASPAVADPAACARTLRRESAKLIKATQAAVAACEAQVRAGALASGTDCRTATSVTVAVATAAARAQGKVTARCCGGDRTCGTGDDETLASLGWVAPACPDLDSAGCTASTAHPGDVAACVTCAGTAAARRAWELLYERFVTTTPGSALAECQEAVTEATSAYVGKRARLLRRCWEARARGAHANGCPVPGDGRTAAALARIEGRLVTRICRACGGPDGACGGGDDLLPSTVGFLATCPALLTPDETSCAGPVSSPAELADCAACVGAALAGCVDRLGVPGFAAYPDACNPPRGTCAAGVECETALDCPAGYTCEDNGAAGTTRYCVGPACAGDPDCGGGGVCRAWCTTAGCGPPRCQCPGFGCDGPDELCIDNGGLACRKICTQDSDCTGVFGGVCVNPGFGFGICIGNEPCS